MAAMVAALIRLAGAGFVMARQGAFALVDPDALPAGPAAAVRLARRLERRAVSDSDRGERLTAALNRLGPSYVKLGQFLATRPDIVGEAVADALGLLRDEIAPFPEEDARATIVRAFGKPVEDIFASFSPPVAAASIAQVHKAVVAEPEGGARTVAVKVLRPGIRRRFRRDLDTFYAGARLIERIDPQARRLRPVAVVDTLARTVAIEMDLRLEAAALSEMAELTVSDQGYRLPSVDWERTARDVLTLEWVDGIKLSDVAALRAAGHDLPALARRLMQTFLRQALRDGFFHADMHQGNFFIDQAGDIVAVDFGIMGRLGKPERRFLAEILYGFVRRDYRRVAEVHFEAGYVPDRHAVDDFAQAIRAIGEPIHGQTARDISMAKLLRLLFEVTEIFDMQTRPELLLVQKTMVVVEGVARSLDPDFDMWSTAEPILADWIERHLGPAGQIERVTEGVGALGRLAGELPRLAERAERLAADFAEMGERGIRLDPETIDKIARSEARGGRWGRIALVVIATVVVIVGLRLVM
ncbi:MAG: 2-polyprenylphenol 6-hydroxylase [Bauldia sp.]